MAVTPPGYAAVGTNIGYVATPPGFRHVVRLSDGSFIGIQARQDHLADPLWKSTDGGSTWTNLTYTPTNWSFSSSPMYYPKALCVDDEDRCYFAFAGYQGGNVNIQIVTFDVSGTTVTERHTVAPNAGGGFSFYPKAMIVIRHPDQSTYPGVKYIWLPYMYNQPAAWCYEARYDMSSGFTQTAHSTTSVISSYLFGPAAAAAVKGIAPGSLQPLSESAPEICIIDRYATNGVQRRKVAWGTTSFSSITNGSSTNNTTGLSNIKQTTSLVWDGTNFVAVYPDTNGNNIRVGTMADGAATLTETTVAMGGLNLNGALMPISLGGDVAWMAQNETAAGWNTVERLSGTWQTAGTLGGATQVRSSGIQSWNVATMSAAAWDVGVPAVLGHGDQATGDDLNWYVQLAAFLGGGAFAGWGIPMGIA